MKQIKINLPFDNKILSNLKVNDKILLSGVIYTARDAAHKKMFDAKKAPINLKGQVIYYTGPTPTPPKKIVGSCGPTTSSRMDEFVDFMVNEIKISAMIGKGKRSRKVIDVCKKNKVLYLIAPGGCGALIADCIRKFELVAYPELLAEAIYKMEVFEMPLVVGIDVLGNYIYE